MTQPTSACEKPPPLLQMQAIDKSFPGVQALKDIHMALHEGQVLALVGENGAGKSTLIKILAGAHLPDSGLILINGRDQQIRAPTGARNAGVSVIYQEFNLVPELTVHENIFLGREAVRHGLTNAKAERRQSLELFRKLGIDVDPDACCSELSVAQQQSVEIAKALSVDARIIVMDEPTASLTTQEVQRLFAIIRELKSRQISVIYISHRLEEIFDVADRVMVLRDGRHVGTYDIRDITLARLIELMVGRPLEAEFPKRTVRIGPERLRVENLNRGDTVRDVSFHVCSGEIVGFAGLVGSGRTETMRIIFGADRPDGGRITIDGTERNIRNPRDAIRNRICLLTEDRKGQGLVVIHSARENFGLPNLGQFRLGPFLDQAKERRRFTGFIDSLKIRISQPDQLVLNLSGGNQQKVVLAKWLASNADIIMFDEPTRGIDVAAKYEIYLIMNQLAAEGKAIIMISSELPEILGMSDRIIVMHQGRVTGRIDDAHKATQQDIMKMAIM